MFTEETDLVCKPLPANSCQQPQPEPFSAAKSMSPAQRRQLALNALAGVQPVSGLAREHHVSRNFVYRQAAKAEEALDEVFGVPSASVQNFGRAGSDGGVGAAGGVARGSMPVGNRRRER